MPVDTRVAPQALCLAGPTASGKSALVMRLAQVLPLEIISVDSALVYRGMDIGTAKPSAADRAAVPHHLIDIVEPTEAYSAARFASEARGLIRDISARGKLPLLVGGTMLYFKALRDGIDTMPAADAGVRAAIEAEAAALGWPAMHAQLAAVDATTAARLAPADAQRIQRALEVWRVSGRPLSHWHGGARDAKPADADEALPLISLEPDSRSWLHERIAQRFAAMLDAGFLAEVQALRARGDLHASLPAMRCVGYRQAWAALESGVPLGVTSSELSTWQEQGIAATRQLAKRQLTWLRSMPRRTVVACDASDANKRGLETLLRAVRRD